MCGCIITHLQLPTSTPKLSIKVSAQMIDHHLRPNQTMKIFLSYLTKDY